MAFGISNICPLKCMSYDTPSAPILYFSECLLLKAEGWRDAGICREKIDIVACEQQRGRPNCASAQSGEQL